MTGVTPSLYDANVGLFQPSQDGYDLWYHQNVNFDDYGQYQQPAQLVNDYYPTVPNQQQESYDNYDQMTSNMHQNQLSPSTAPPSVKQLQETHPNKTKPMLTRDKDGNSNRNGGKAFKRRPGACTQCKQVKMKCDFSPGEQTCQRCKPKGYHCVVEAQKPRVYERDRLLIEIRQKDAIIETLLKQLHNPYLATPHSINEYFKSVSPSDANNPDVLAWLSRLKSGIQISMGRSTEASEEGSGRLPHDQQSSLLAHSEVQEHEEMPTLLIESSRVPVGFRPERRVTSRTEKEREREIFQRVVAGEAQENSPEPGFRLGGSMGLNYPEILALGLVTAEDAKQLFDIFYKHINPFIALLDLVLLTPKSTLARCPVLFTVMSMHFAKQSAANALVLDEMKSIELCQAYLLMSVYAVPERSWDRDQTWLYTGLAVSIATALHLDQTPKINSATESEEREYLNRVRVWKFCSLLDQATAIQFGKPLIMKEDTITRYSGEWYRQSLYNLDYDVFLCGYDVLLRIVARFHEEVLLDRSGPINSERGNLRDVTMKYDLEIEIFKEEWKRKFKAGGAHRGAILRRSELHLYVHNHFKSRVDIEERLYARSYVAYFRLVMFSFGFHRVFHAGKESWYDYFFTKCLEYAKSVIRCMNEDLAPTGFMRYAPDHHFMCSAFAAVFLFKLVRPEFLFLLNKADNDESVKLIEILISKLSASNIAVDDRHAPKLYARFLATVLDKYQKCQETASGSPQTVPPVNMGTSRSVPGETGKENSDNWKESYVAQGYASAGFNYWPEATHATGGWPIPFGSDAELLHIMNGSQNINGNVEMGSGNMETAMITSIQNLDNTTEWLQEVLMSGYGLRGIPPDVDLQCTSD
ncbi:hypothetical protein EDD85DRAFT_1025365, partial [Armillaria nabsnona]